jgi:hypothetical protein
VLKLVKYLKFIWKIQVNFVLAVSLSCNSSEIGALKIFWGEGEEAPAWQRLTEGQGSVFWSQEGKRGKGETVKVAVFFALAPLRLFPRISNP